MSPLCHHLVTTSADLLSKTQRNQNKKYFNWSISVADLPKPNRSFEWGCCSHVPPQVAFCDRSNLYFYFFQRRPEEYKKKVAEYVKKYATEDALRETDKVRLICIFWYLCLHCFVFCNNGGIFLNIFFRRTSPLPPRARCRTFLRTRRKTWNYNLKASWGTSLPPPEDCHSDSSPQWNVLSQTDSQHYCRCFHWSIMVTCAPLWDSHSTVLCYLVSIYVDIKERWREVF